MLWTFKLAEIELKENSVEGSWKVGYRKIITCYNADPHANLKKVVVKLDFDLDKIMTKSFVKIKFELDKIAEINKVLEKTDPNVIGKKSAANCTT